MAFESSKNTLKYIYDILITNNLNYEVFEGYTQKDNFNQLSNYIVYFLVSGTNLKNGDNCTLLKQDNIQISLFTNKKNIQAEDEIERLLTDNDIIYTKVQNNISEQKLVQIIYDINVLRKLQDN